MIIINGESILSDETCQFFVMTADDDFDEAFISLELAWPDLILIEKRSDTCRRYVGVNKGWDFELTVFEKDAWIKAPQELR